jgi:DDE superfamily endonuclease
MQRPHDPEEQQEDDRGKMTCHTLKNLVVITETCHMCFSSHTSEGQASDKSLAELARYTLATWQLSVSR